MERALSIVRRRATLSIAALLVIPSSIFYGSYGEPGEMDGSVALIGSTIGMCLFLLTLPRKNLWQ